MANWKLHKYYRGVVLENIRDRLNELEACPFSLNKTQTHLLLKIITKAKSTALMDNKQFLEYLEEVWCIGAHIGIYIFEPNEERNADTSNINLDNDTVLPIDGELINHLCIDM